MDRKFSNTNGSFYDTYLQSEQWFDLKKQIKERDGYKCMICSSTEDLEVHHNTYDRLGNERLEDLITVCKQCHDVITSMIRDRRYQNIDHEPSGVMRTTPNINNGADYGKEDIKIRTHRRITPPLT